jgi:gluconate 2-dehydrogenase gamma chain
MDRRTVLKLLAAGVLAERLESAQHHLVTIAQTPAAYKLQFFSRTQNELLERLTEMLIPADEHSPGAREAKVSLFLDLMVANSRRDIQQRWSSGLRAVDAAAQSRFARPFLRLNAAEQDQVVQLMADHEGSPTNELERFFAVLKSMTIDGYYTSRTGIHEDLQYKGNTALPDYPGCTHPEHRT